MNTSTVTLPNGSNIMLVPLNQAKTNSMEPLARNKQIQLRSKSLLALSIINIILWTLSTLLQVAALVAFNVQLFSFYWPGWDVGGWGIWCSIFYAISGFTGYSASYSNKRPLIVTSLVFAVFSLASSVVAATFAGIQATESMYGYRCRQYDYNTGMYTYNWYECGVWSGIEWALMSISILAFAINLSVVVITSMAICNCCNRKSNSRPGVVAPHTTMQYPVPTVVPYAAPLSPVANQQFNPTTQQQNYSIFNQQAYPLQQHLQQQQLQQQQLQQQQLQQQQQIQQQQQLQQQHHEGLLQLPSVSEAEQNAVRVGPLTVETQKY